MFLQPKKTKFKKIHKKTLSKFKLKSNLSFGGIGLKTLQSGTITARQIEAARRAISRKTGRKGKVWIKIFPDLPITAKSSGVRMGRGVGKLSHWGVKVKCGTILFEIAGVTRRDALQALRTSSMKLPVKTKTIESGGFGDWKTDSKSSKKVWPT